MSSFVLSFVACRKLRASSASYKGFRIGVYLQLTHSVAFHQINMFFLIVIFVIVVVVVVAAAITVVGRDSSVGIATRYGLYYPGIKSRRG